MADGESITVSRVSKVQRLSPLANATGTAKCVQCSLSVSKRIYGDTEEPPVTLELSLIFSPSEEEMPVWSSERRYVLMHHIRPAVCDTYPGYILQTTVMTLGSSSWVIDANCCRPIADLSGIHYKAWW